MKVEMEKGMDGNRFLDGESYRKMEQAVKAKRKGEFEEILAGWMEKDERLAGVYFGIAQGILLKNGLECSGWEGVRLRSIEEFEENGEAISYLADLIKGGEAETGRERKAVRWTKIYVERHLGEEISMWDIASHLDLNYSYFSRMFRQAAGSSFSGYVYERRMQEARIRLGRGERVKDVAALVGYQEVKSFSRAFRRRFGVAPSTLFRN